MEHYSHAQLDSHSLEPQALEYGKFCIEVGFCWVVLFCKNTLNKSNQLLFWVFFFPFNSLELPHIGGLYWNAFPQGFCTP